MALGDKNEIKEFHYKEGNHGKSSFLKDTINNPFEKRRIKIKRFDKLKVKINRPCFIKIDVEGFEANVLRGFGKRLKEVDGVLLEYNREDNFMGQSTLKDIVDILNKYNINKMRHFLEGERSSDLFFYR